MPRAKEEIRGFTGGIVGNKTARDLVSVESPEVINMSSAKIGSLLTCNKPTDYYGSATSPADMDAVQANYGYHVFKSDWNVDTTPALQTNGVNLELYVDTSDTGTSVQVYDGANFFDCGVIGTDTSGKLVFYDTGGALRISDADFTNTANFTYWFGMIEHKFLQNDSATIFASGVGHKDWAFLKNELPPPTANTGNFAGGAATAPDYGVGYALQIAETTGETTGLWTAGVYEFAFSHVYMGGQESKLTNFSSSYLTMGATEKSQKMNITVKVTVPTADGDLASGNSNWERMIGGRIYWRNKDKKGSWKLFVDMDLKENGGARLSLTDDYSGFSTATSPVWTATSSGPNPMTYESLNGHRSGDVFALGFGESASFAFSTAIIAKSRAWVANVRYKDEFGTTKTMGDRILYTPPGKYDTFPTNYWLDIGASDGEAFVKLEFLNGMLLAFKTNTLYVISIAAANEAAWGVQSIHSHMGIGNHNATCQLKNAIVWANQDGVYMFAGGQVTEISLKAQPLIGNELTADGDKACVGYDVINKEVIVRLDVNGTTAWIFHIPTQSWYKTDEFGTLNQTNFSMIDNVLTWQEHDSGNSRLDTRKRTSVIAVDSTTTNSTNSWTSKDFDFNVPGTPKKIYAITFYYSVQTNTNKCLFDYATDGGSLGNTTDLPTIASDASPQRYKFTPPLKCNSFQLRFKSTLANSIELESITIEYRALTTAKVE